MVYQYSERVIDRHERRKLVPYSDVHILRLERKGLFPKRIRLGSNRIGWLWTEVLAWIADKKAQRDAEANIVEGVQHNV